MMSFRFFFFVLLNRAIFDFPSAANGGWHGGKETKRGKQKLQNKWISKNGLNKFINTNRFSKKNKNYYFLLKNSVKDRFILYIFK